MELNWLQSILYGFLSGLADILPVSAEAHRVLLLKFFGVSGHQEFVHLFIHLGVFAALYFSCSAHLIRMSRARRLSHVPKRKRKRPLDTRSLMDLSFLRTISVPVILALFLWQRVQGLEKNLLVVAAFLLLNAIVLYIPQFLPSGNRDARTLSRVEGLLMGLAGGASILPGISGMGAATAVASVCGVDRVYGLNMALMMNMVLNAGYAVHDVITVVDVGIVGMTFSYLIRCVLTAAAAFGGTLLGIRTMRTLAESRGYSYFGLYCLGLSLFTFVLNLMA